CGYPVLLLLPQAKTPEECVRVVAGAAARWQRVQLVDVAASEHDVLRLERGHQTTDDVLHIAPPLPEPVRLQSAQADVLLESSVPVRQMAQLHRLNDAFDDESRAQAGSQA